MYCSLSRPKGLNLDSCHLRTIKKSDHSVDEVDIFIKTDCDSNTQLNPVLKTNSLI